MQPCRSFSARYGGAQALHAALCLVGIALVGAQQGGGDALLNAIIIEVRRPLSAGVRNNRHHISLDELVASDEEDRRIPLRFVDASPQVKQGRQGRAPANAIDGDLGTRTHNNFGPGVRYGVEDHWMQFSFDAKFGSRLRKVRVHATHHAAKQRMKGVKLSLLLPTKGNALIAQKTIEFWGADVFEWDLPLEVQNQLGSLPLDEVVDSLQAKVEELQKSNSNLEQQVTELQAQLAAPMASHDSLFDTFLGAADHDVPSRLSPLYLLAVGAAALLTAQTLKQQQVMMPAQTLKQQQAHIKGHCAGDLEQLCDAAQAWRTPGKECDHRKENPTSQSLRHIIRIEVSGQKKLQDLASRVLLRLPKVSGAEPSAPADVEADPEAQHRPDDEVFELVDARALADGACTLELQRKPARSDHAPSRDRVAADAAGDVAAAAPGGAGGGHEEPREALPEAEEVHKEPQGATKEAIAVVAEESGIEAEVMAEATQRDVQEEGELPEKETDAEKEEEDEEGDEFGDEDSESDACSEASSIVLVESAGPMGFD